jgi:hypothetical protein
MNIGPIERWVLYFLAGKRVPSMKQLERMTLKELRQHEERVRAAIVAREQQDRTELLNKMVPRLKNDFRMGNLIDSTLIRLP